MPKNPVPTAAVYNTGTLELSVSFSSSIAAGSISDNELRLFGAGLGPSLRKNDAQSHAGGTTIVFTTITRTGIPTGTNYLRYVATSSELVGANGLPVLAFDNFPLTIV